jgi:3-keto-5-aminohexanoate cleavage enzyme
VSDHEKPCIISVALTGVITDKAQQPNLPCTPEQIVLSAIESWHEGASIAHCHTRGPNGERIYDKVMFAEIKSGIEEQSDLIVNLTTSYYPPMTHDQRFEVVELQPEMASFNSGSLNFGDLGIYENSPAFMKKMAEQMLEHNVRPEFEIFDIGQIGNVTRLIEQGLFKPPYLFQFVMGPKGAMPADAQLLTLAVRMLPAESEWLAIGVGRKQLEMNALSILWGGHPRTGFEDNVFYRKGELASSNAQLVARVKRLALELGRPVATPAQARAMLGLAAKKTA